MRPQLPATRDSRRGNYLMTTGVFLPILVAFAALSVDISYINMARTQTQNVADAASHAAYIGYRSSSNDVGIGNDAAGFVVSKNAIGDGYGNLDDVQYGEWDFDAYTFDPSSSYVNSARALVSRSRTSDGDTADGFLPGADMQLELFFAPILNTLGTAEDVFKEASVNGIGVSAGRTRQIILVTDVSCSFAGEMNQARSATVAFLNYMRDNPYPGDLIGHTVFAGRKNFPVLSHLQSPTDHHANLLAEFNQLQICSKMTGDLKGSPTDSNSCFTSQARGLHYALQEFISGGSSKEFQAVVMLTDGKANTDLDASSDGGQQSQAQDDAEMLVDVLWSGGTFSYVVWECPIGQAKVNSSCVTQTYAGNFDGGVHLWTVYFGSGSANINWLESLVARNPGNLGKAYDTDDPSKLDDIYVEIASSVPVVVVD